MKNILVKCIKMDVSYYGIYYTNVKYYPAKEEELDSFSLRTEDGYWFGIDLNRQIPVNVHLFFFDGKWNHYFDSNIYCENVKVKYVD